MTSSRRLAFWTALPTAAVLALILFAPWSILRRVPGGGVMIEKQELRLMNAAERGSPELLRLLTRRGANVNERLPANPETTALSIARDRNTPAAVDVLLKAGAGPLST